MRYILVGWDLLLVCLIGIRSGGDILKRVVVGLVLDFLVGGSLFHDGWFLVCLLFFGFVVGFLVVVRLLRFFFYRITPLQWLEVLLR